jgi:hypothetical protein
MNSQRKKKHSDRLVEPRPQLTIISPPRQNAPGRDELNFAEFPISVLSDRVAPGVKTIQFEDTIFDRELGKDITRRVTLTGADAFGLPTQTDEQVLMALIQIAKENNFESKRVEFSRYELLKILGWKDAGSTYQRVKDAILRWTGVTIRYESAWREKVSGTWAPDQTFHILDRASFRDPDGDESAKNSFIEWNEVPYRSFRAGNIKSLDYDFFLSLRSSVSKRLYRFLDKRFYHRDSLEFDLNTLAYEHIGIARTTPTGELKRTFNTAIDELETRGFLEPTPPVKRFTKVKTKVWRVHFVRQKIQVLDTPTTSDSSLLGRLIGFGVSPEKAEALIRMGEESSIEEKLQVAEWLKGNRDARISRNPAGYLVKSIEDAFSVPTDFKEQKLREQLEVERAEARREGEERKRKLTQRQKEKEERRNQIVLEYWAGVSEEKKAEILSSEIERAPSLKRDIIARGGPGADALIEALLRDYALEAIANG